MLVVCMPLCGCATFGLIDWSATEVSVYGQAIDLDKSLVNAIGLNIHDVPSTPDGTYVLRVPEESATLPVVEAADGVLEVQPLMTLELLGNTPTAFKHEGFSGGPDDDGFRRAGQSRCRQEQLGTDRVRVHRLRRTPRVPRTPRPCGRQSQSLGSGRRSRNRTRSHSSARRPLAVVLLPFAVVADIIMLPIYAVAAAFASSRDLGGGLTTRCA